MADDIDACLKEYISITTTVVELVEKEIKELKKIHGGIYLSDNA